MTLVHGWKRGRRQSLVAETVKNTTLPLESVDDVEGGDGLALGVLGVGNSVTNSVLEEDLEDTTSLLVDQTRDTLDTTTTSQTADSGLGDTLDVVTKDLAVPLGATLAQTLASLSSTRHCVDKCLKVGWLRGGGWLVARELWMREGEM